MNNIINNKNILLQNFNNCINWEEKYLYIIELGNYLPTIQNTEKLKKNLVSGCQSNVWIITKMQRFNVINGKKIIDLFGDSDTAITKGILFIIFTVYQGLSADELIQLNPYPFLNQLELTEHLTYSRSQGIQSIIRFIYHQVKTLIYQN